MKAGGQRFPRLSSNSAFCAIVARFEERGRELKRAIVVVHGLFEALHGAQRVCAVVPADRVFDIDRQRGIEPFQRLVMALQFGERGRAVRERVHETRPDREGLVERGDRFLEAPFAHQEHALGVSTVRHARIAAAQGRERALTVPGRLGQVRASARARVS